MKLRFKSIIVISLALVFSTATTHLVAAVSYTSRNIPTHVDFMQIDTEMEGFFYEDLPDIPYITLDSYLGIMGETVVTTVSDGNYSLVTESNPDNPMNVNP